MSHRARGDRMAQAVVGVGDHQLDALETALDQALEESRPERLGFGRAETQTDHIAPAFGGDRHGDYRTDHPPRSKARSVARSGVRLLVTPQHPQRPRRSHQSRGRHGA
jgi:hypothetical protein